jgi:thiosulfate/3-mercaptopyruvate sulfurtransferase
MNLQTLIDVPALAELIRHDDVLVVDCRFALADPAAGARVYAQSHIPGAVHADLDRDLSDLTKAGLGRHPLPEATAFSAVLARWGWTPQTRVIAYDAANGALAAARLWWMLRLVGAREVAVLDGGWPAWRVAGLPVDAETRLRTASRVAVEFEGAQIIYTDEMLAQQQSMLLLDARAAPRYRGEVEPIDPVAGHVPGARNRPSSDNLDATGNFKSAQALRAEFDALLGARPASDVVHMCGSGVTACHNLLAMEHAGLHGSRIYAPSWSGYISDSHRPVAIGAS